MQTSKRAFTLIELLVVISIILIASSVIFIGGNGGDGAKLSSAQRIVAGIAQGARGQAILKNATCRLIIYSENNDGASAASSDYDKKLRFFGIVYEETPDSNKWIAATQGTYLPEGIYFNKTLSGGHQWTESTMNISFPRLSAQSVGSGDEFYYYEFNSNGTMATDYDNTWLVLQAGSLDPQNGYSVDFTGEDKQGLKSALIFRRVGTTTKVNDPSQI